MRSPLCATLVSLAVAATALQANTIPPPVAWYEAGSFNAETGIWTDSSSNHLDLTAQGSPTYNGGALNGQPTVGFGPGAYFASPGAVSGGVWGANDADVFIVLEQNNPATGNTAISWVWSGSNRFLFHTPFANALYLEYGQSCCGTDVAAANVPAGWSNAFHLLEGSRNGSTGAITLDGTPLSLFLNDFTDSLDTTQSTTLFVGNDVFGNNFQGQIAEILVYDTALGATDRQTVTNYLDQKYGTFPSSVPEPSSFALGALALGALAAWRRRRPA